MADVKLYRMLKDSALEPSAKAGTVVYAYAGYDYGMARDDTRIANVPHISVTLDPEGGPPFFTVAVADLEEKPS